ncbi:MAG: TonB-dependent siderophore receptor [Cyanobacteria bacterium P01_H01_bin.21]
MRLWSGLVSLQLAWVLTVAGGWALSVQAEGGADELIDEHLNGVSKKSLSPFQALTQMPLVQITSVRLEEADTGLNVILETANGELSTPTTSVSSNALIIEIANAVLTGEGFEQFEPVEEIAFVQVSALSDNRVQVVITGIDAAPAADVSTDATGLTLSVVPGIAQIGDADEPLRLVVTAEENEGYNPSGASTATRTDTPLRDIPQSVQVVPQEVLRDQNVTSLNDALENISSVTTAIGSEVSNIGAVFNIRGFDISARSGGSFLRNGLREGGDILLDFAPNIESIEVLLGPASVLYGNASPGGTINIVTKQPLNEPFYAVDATIGSNDFYQGAVDLSGPLNEPGTLLYRLNVGYRDTGSFIDFFESDTFTIAPVVSWKISDRTRLTVEGEYTDESSITYGGLPAVGTVLPNPNGDIPRDRFTGEPDSVFNNTIGRIGYRFEHEFSDNWSLQNAFSARFQRGRPGNDFYILTEEVLAADNRTLYRQAIDNNVDFDDYDVSTFLTGKFSTGSIEHNLLAGIDLSRSSLEFERLSTIFTPLDIFNPVYGNVAGPSVFEFDGDQLTEVLGLYIQDQVTLADNLKLLLGGRLDIFDQDFRFLANTDSASGEAFSPRVGIVYQPIEPISLYASYSRSFTPVTGTVFGGGAFEPQRGTQYEVGLKADVTDQLSATLALYDLTLTNVSTSDPNNPGFLIQTGEQRSRGIELSTQGEILPGWNIIAGYAYTDAEVTEDNVIPVGNQLAGVPEHAFNLWTTYEIQSGDLEGLGAGLGVFFVGERQGNLNNSFQIPDYLRTDAAIFYNKERFRAAINLRNLFDIDYFDGFSSFGDFVYPGEPLIVQASVSWEF